MRLCMLRARGCVNMMDCAWMQAISGDKAKDKSQVMSDECSKLSIAPEL